MRRAMVIGFLILISGGAVYGADPAGHDAGAPPQRPHPRPAPPREREIDVNRPRTPFDCELPIGENWYGSRARCLAFLCGSENVYNEYIFDADGRRRKNPCYGQSPTEFPPE